MRRTTVIPALLTAAAMLCSCSTSLPYMQTSDAKEAPAQEAPEEAIADDLIGSGNETALLPQTHTKDLYSPSDFVVSPSEYNETYQLEFNTDAYSYTDGLHGFRGTGFISLGGKDYATLKVTVPSSQHYKIGLRACTTGAKIAIITGGTREVTSADGTYTTFDGEAVGAVYIKESTDFEYFYLDNVYLRKGENNLTFQMLSGVAYLDEVSIDSSSTVPELAYAVSSGCAVNDPSENVKIVKKYLSDVYGNRVLTGQYCSAGTNTEINAIYMDTGRYSAIRCSDLGIFTEYYTGSDRQNEQELTVAADWWKSGGLVSYSWYWYSPSEENSACFMDLTDFRLSKAVSEADPALLDADGLATYEQTGRISRSCYDLIRDIDAVAAKLKLLAAEGVPVLFRPLPEAGNGWYWWGESAESYLWLYGLLFTRLTAYHELNNLIWVWDGENYDYYPGDDRVDIVGMDVYSSSDISANSRMMDALHYTIRTKACALTECGRVPNPDLLKRDNALWLWFALWKGDYIIDPEGGVSYDRVTHDELDYAYNNELFVTKDELPDFSRYY